MKQTILGIAIAVVGLFILLANLNIGDSREIFAQWWPMGIIALGIYMWWVNRSNAVWALLVALFGVIALINTLNLAEFDYGQVVVPLIIVGVGLAIIARARSRTSLGASSKKEEEITAILGGSSGKNNSDDYRGGNVTSVMGGVELDISRATIKKDAILTLFVLVGGVELRVPSNVIVKNRTRAIFGGLEDGTHADKGKTAPTLYIEGDIVMGGVEVKR